MGMQPYYGCKGTMGQMQYKIFPISYMEMEIAKKDKKQSCNLIDLQPHPEFCKLINPMVMGNNCNLHCT